MPQLVVTLPNFNMSSTWDGYYDPPPYVYYSTPSTDTENKDFNISSLPTGAIPIGATLSAVLGSPYTGAAIRTVDGTTFYSPRDVLLKIQALNGNYTAPVRFTFRFKANGGAGGFGDHESVLGVNTLTLTIEYILPASTGALNLSQVDIGQMIRLQNIVSQDAGYTHKLRWTLLGQKEQVQTLAAGVTYSDFTLPASGANSWYTLLPNTMSGAAQVILETYSGTTLIGSNNYTFTAKVGASVIPTISGLASTPYSDTTPAIPSGWNLYVQGKSKATINATIAAGAGSTVKSVKVEGGGFTGWALPFTTGLLMSAGGITFTVTVTDMRDSVKSLTVSITVTAYAAPRISGVSFSRAATSGGAPDPNGTYIRGVATISFDAIGGNTLTVKAYYRQRGNTTWLPAGGVSVTSATPFWMGGGAINLQYPYDVMLEAADALSTVPITTMIPTALRWWDFRADRAAFGRYASNTKEFALPDDWESRYKGQTLDARFRKVSDTIPVSGGGTGAVDGANACANIGAVKKSGDTMTGELILPNVRPRYTGTIDDAPTVQPEGISYGSVSAYPGTLGYSTFLTLKDGNWRVTQLLIHTHGDEMYFRGGYNTNGWYGWKRLYSNKNITHGTASPSGGSSGDIYLKHL